MRGSVSFVTTGLVYGLVEHGGENKEMVRVTSSLSIDHEIKARYMRAVGVRNMSNDVEGYMKWKADKYEKIKNKVVPDQGTTNLNSETDFDSSSNLKSVIINQEKITLDVLNDPRLELNVAIDKIQDTKTLNKVVANAHMVESLAKTRLKRRLIENG